MFIGVSRLLDLILYLYRFYSISSCSMSNVVCRPTLFPFLSLLALHPHRHVCCMSGREGGRARVPGPPAYVLWRVSCRLPLRLYRRKIHPSSWGCHNAYTARRDHPDKLGPCLSVFLDSINVLTWRARHVSLYMNFLPHGLEFHRGGRKSFGQGNLRPFLFWTIFRLFSWLKFHHVHDQKYVYSYCHILYYLCQLPFW